MEILDNLGKVIIADYQRMLDQAGKKAFLWPAEGTVVVFFYENNKSQIQKWNPIHGASLRCIKDTP